MFVIDLLPNGGGFQWSVESIGINVVRESEILT